MIATQDARLNIMLAPQELSAAGTASGYLDTLGWDQAKILVSAGTYASDAKTVAVLALSEGTNSAAATDVVAFKGTTNTGVTAGTDGFVIPDGVSTGGQIIAFDVDLRKRERFLKISVTAGTAAVLVGVNALMTRGREMPGPSDGDKTTHVIG